MAVDPRKRQKKLQRKAAKDKAKKKVMAFRERNEVAIRMQGASKAPLLHCVRGGIIFDQGMGTVIVSRKLTTGEVACAVFLVDMFCLGVKSAFCSILTRGDYDERIYNPAHERESLVPISIETARNLVEGAIAFAAQFGFAPDRDYAKAKLIFGDADPAQSTEAFTFGKGGKPFYISGPMDSTVRSQRIVELLEQHCGRGNFDYLINPLAGPHFNMLSDHDGDPDDDEEAYLEEAFDDEGEDDLDDANTIEGRFLRHDG